MYALQIFNKKMSDIIKRQEVLLEATPGGSPAPGMCNKGFGGCQHA